MKRNQLQVIATALSCASMIISPATAARAGFASMNTTTDVQLYPGGTLVGQIVDAQGVAMTECLPDCLARQLWHVSPVGSPNRTTIG